VLRVLRLGRPAPVWALLAARPRLLLLPGRAPPVDYRSPLACVSMLRQLGPRQEHGGRFCYHSADAPPHCHSNVIFIIAMALARNLFSLIYFRAQNRLPRAYEM
jgi:hypothetical protein